MSSHRSFFAQAPSNIALIKYMGKTDSNKNLPENPSLSLTLQSLRTEVEVVRTREKENLSRSSRWLPEAPRRPSTKGLQPPQLDATQLARVQKHVVRTCDLLISSLEPYLSRYRIRKTKPGELEFRTVNTFPAQAGIASSASSFAAITLATAMSFFEDQSEFERFWRENPNFREVLAGISRQGSGSSCRSFRGPWVKWERESAFALETRFEEMTDLVLLVSEAPKKVGSSEAHRRVKTSPLWEGRVERVQGRMKRLENAIFNGDLKTVALTSWIEAWEMHSLFHTSGEPFTYWEGETVEILKWISADLEAPTGEEPPIVTLDAGPNIHILVKKHRASHWKSRIGEAFPRTKILEDTQGTGANPISHEGGSENGKVESTV